MNLSHRRFCGFIQLQLDHINPFTRAEHQVNASFSGVVLAFDKDIQHHEDYINDRMIIMFFFPPHAIGNVREQDLKLFHVGKFFAPWRTGGTMDQPSIFSGVRAALAFSSSRKFFSGGELPASA